MNFIEEFNRLMRDQGDMLSIKSLAIENRALRIVLERHFAESATLDEMREALEDVRDDLQEEAA